MEKRIVLILIIIMVVSGNLLLINTQAQDTTSCDNDPVLYQVFGIYCLNPVTWDIPEMQHPIGSIVLFWDGSQTDMGIVSGYSWQPKEQLYAYWIIVSPADWNRNPPFAGEYKIALPNEVYGVR